MSASVVIEPVFVVVAALVSLTSIGLNVSLLFTTANLRRELAETRGEMRGFRDGLRFKGAVVDAVDAGEV